SEESGRVQGKQAVFNAFCGSPRTNWYACTICHIGYGWKDPANPVTSDDQVDCLVCHEKTGTYRKFPYGYAVRKHNGRIIRKPDFVKVARSVGKPNRKNCGVCHFNGGGHDGAKHGDLDSSLIAAPRALDIHMSPRGLDFSCTTCHAGMGHRISGSRYHMKARDTVGIDRPGHTDHSRTSCESCHGRHPHADSVKLNDHTDRVACQSCHIPTIARGGVRTKTHWDWRSAGVEPEPAIDQDPDISHSRHHGTITWGEDLVPEYHWFNGETDFILISDTIDDSKPVRINTISGDADDPEARIWPFKIMRVQMPYDPVNKNLVVNHAVPEDRADSDAFDISYDWQRSVRAGMKGESVPFSGQVGFVAGEMFMPITHMVAPKEMALGCEECHSPHGRLAAVAGVYLPGRDRFPLATTFWSGVALLALAGIALHIVMRLLHRQPAQPTKPWPQPVTTRLVTIFSRYERFSHWGQAILIVGLMLTGFHVAGHFSWIPYGTAAHWHRILAWSLILFWVFAVFWLIVTGEWRQYLPTTEKLKAMVSYYLNGMFHPDRYTHPFRKSRRLKHNPLQRFSYFILSVVISPLIWLSGLLYVTINDLDRVGLDWLPLQSVAFVHLTMAYMLFVFLLVHVYMAFVGKPVTSHLRSMLTGKVAEPLDVMEDGGHYQVLMVEDDPDFSALVQQWLCGQPGAEVKELLPSAPVLKRADSLKAAFKALHRDNYDLILLDLGLPDSSGLASFTQIHTAFPETPIVLLTGLEQEATGAEAVHLGAQDVLRKSEVNPIVLARAIRYARYRHQIETFGHDTHDRSAAEPDDKVS
ncbi:MAG: tetrathionate reductase family octaheme c-type cytochrome, partial [Magnetococcales bacterium]|nr:tetrathionate reductase family octaheme c-type cytochrome [Magnetococcales bacterium]